MNLTLKFKIKLFATTYKIKIKKVILVIEIIISNQYQSLSNFFLIFNIQLIYRFGNSTWKINLAIHTSSLNFSANEKFFLLEKYIFLDAKTLHEKEFFSNNQIKLPSIASALSENIIMQSIHTRPFFRKKLLHFLKIKLLIVKRIKKLFSVYNDTRPLFSLSGIII
jgi:hypothetical protein